MIETKSKLRRSWYDYNWDWALILLFALVVLVGNHPLDLSDHPQTAVISGVTRRTEHRTNSPGFRKLICFSKQA